MAEEQTPETVTTNSDYGQFGAISRMERETSSEQLQPFDGDALEQARAKDLESQKATEKPEQIEEPKQEPKEPKEPDERRQAQDETKQVEEQDDKEINPLDVLPKSKKKQKDWLNLRENYESQIEDLKSQLNEAKTNPEINKLKEELSQYRELLKEVSIEKDPSFNKTFEVKKNSIINQVKAVAGSKAQELEELLKMPDSNYRNERIDALKEDLSSSAKSLINNAVDRLNGIELDRRVEIDARKSNWEENQERLSELEQRKARERESTFENAFKKTLRQWQDEEEGHFLYQITDETKSAVEKDVNYAKNLVGSIQDGSIKPEDAAKVGLHLAAIPRLQSYLENVINERDELKAKVEKFYKSSPEGGTSGQSGAPSKAPKNAFDDGYQDYFLNELERARNSS